MIKLDIKLGDLYCHKQWHDSDYDRSGGYYEDEILIAIEEDRHIWENKDGRSKILWTISKEDFEKDKITEESLNKVGVYTKDNIELRLNLSSEPEWGEFSYFENFLSEQNVPTTDSIVNIMYELIKENNLDSHQMKTLLSAFNASILKEKHFRPELKNWIREIISNPKSDAGLKNDALNTLEQNPIQKDVDFVREICNIPIKENWLTGYQKAIVRGIDGE